MSSVTLIISISAIILLLYIIYSILRGNSYTGSIAAANAAQTVTLQNNTSSAASYSIWIYVTEWSVTKYIKNIFSRSGVSIGLDGTTNYLIVTVPNIVTATYKKYPYYYSPVSASATYNYATNDSCELLCTTNTECYGFNYYDKPGSVQGATTINKSGQAGFSEKGCILINSATTPNDLINTSSNVYSELKNKTSDYVIKSFIPIQEWVFISVNMDAHYTEVYINGKMVQTIINTNQKHVGNAILSLDGKGFNGFNSKFENSDKTLTPQQIWNSYKSGFGYYSSLSDYSIKIGFYKDDV